MTGDLDLSEQVQRSEQVGDDDKGEDLGLLNWFISLFADKSES